MLIVAQTAGDKISGFKEKLDRLWHDIHLCYNIGAAEKEKFIQMRRCKYIGHRRNAYWLAADEDRLASYLSLLYSIGRCPPYREKDKRLYLSLESLLQTM